jgi:hypothetical protein
MRRYSDMQKYDINYWWFGINNVKARNKSSCHVIYPEIEKFLTGEQNEFVWKYGGAAYSKKFYSQMSAGDKIVLWMGHGWHEQWGILGFAYISDSKTIEGKINCLIKQLYIPETPLMPYPKNHPHETENTIFLKDTFGLDFYALKDVFYQVKYANRRTTPVTVDKITPDQYSLLLERLTSRHIILPEEIKVKTDKKFYEGAVKQITVNAYERDPEARKKCLDVHGVNCSICGFNFEKKYGEAGKGFIHVHHLKPLSEIAEKYELNPAEDLRPVCPNCHAMLHKRKPPYSIEELKQIISFSSDAYVNIHR